MLLHVVNQQVYIRLLKCLDQTLEFCIDKKYVGELSKEDFIKHLLDRGANVNAFCTLNASPLEVSRRTIFSYACRKANVQIVKLMIDRGADVNCMDMTGLSPICYAFKSGEKEKIELFLDNGLDAAKINRLRLLHKYILSGAAAEAMIERLLQLGADVNCLNNLGYTPLNYAVLHYGLRRGDSDEDLKIIKLILQSGADQNLGKCSLTQAAGSGHEKVVKLLIKFGASVNGRPGDEKTPLTVAASFGHEEIVKLLLKLGGGKRDDRALYEAVNWQSETTTRIVKLLLERGFDPNCLTNHETPLIKAVNCRNTVVVKLLLGHGARMDRLTPMGQYALRRAVVNNCPEIVESLVERGADVNVKWCGMTVLQMSIRKGFKGISEVLVRQIALLKYQNQFVSEINLKALKSVKQLRRCFEIFTSELELLSANQFEDSTLS